ncbi:NAD-dependent epimerase/dehydratase family protein [Pelagibacteraceae bacterium]|nr:NAD-dependent epimerase/dehydratase family protein [Pelagibacteraceae bacterium]
MNKIIGSGFLAKSFLKKIKKINNNTIIFVSGVSNSSSLEKKEYSRETRKINSLNIKKEKLLVYFSSCAVMDPNRRKKNYFQHKIKMEKIIKKKFNNFLIIRLPEVVGRNKNKNTLVNFFYNKILNKKKFYVYKNAKRNLINIIDVVRISIFLMNKKNLKNDTINVANPKFYEPLKIVKNLEMTLCKKGNYEVLNKKTHHWVIDLRKIKKLIPNYSNIYKKDYMLKILKSYYTF